MRRGQSQDSFRTLPETSTSARSASVSARPVSGGGRWPQPRSKVRDKLRKLIRKADSGIPPSRATRSARDRALEGPQLALLLYHRHAA
jgi:hypothetical protein